VVPAGVTTEHAVFAEPIAAACEILDQIKIPKGSEVAVLGDGKLGLLIAQVLHAHGAKVVQFGKHQDKLSIATAAGIETECNPKRLPAKAFPFVVDSTGSSNGLSAAIGMARPRGTVVMKSTVHDAVAINTAPVIVDEITLVGSRCGRMEPALKLLRKKILRLDDMIAGTYLLGQAPEAFARATSSGVLKVLLKTK
jgi:alcohol dehydrogenase